VLLVENSGLDWWLYPELARDTFSGHNEWDGYFSWHRYEEEHLHKPAVNNSGPFRLVVDRRLSKFTAEQRNAVNISILSKAERYRRGWRPRPFRRFSIYMAASVSSVARWREVDITSSLGERHMRR